MQHFQEVKVLGWGDGSVVQHSLSMHESLDLIPSTIKLKIKIQCLELSLLGKCKPLDHQTLPACGYRAWTYISGSEGTSKDRQV